MTMLFMDSFSHYSSSHLSRKYNTVLDPATINASGGRNGNASLQVLLSNAQGQRGVSKTVTPHSTGTIGVAMNPSAVNGAADVYFLQILDTGSPQLGVRLLADGRIGIYRGALGSSAQLGATTYAVAGSSYHYYELKYTIDVSVGALELRIDGDPKLTLTGQNTSATGNATANGFFLGVQNPSVGANRTITLQYSDLVVMDDQGSLNNTFVGDVRVQALFPTSNGTTNDWTPSTGSNYENVDDATPNDDTDYNSTSNPGDIDLFAYGALTPTAGAVLGIQPVMCARKDDGGTRVIAPVLRPTSTNYVGTSQSITTSYAFYTEVIETNGDTSSPFTIAELNAMEAGVKLIS
jgi:hypothetical protein